jgi:hypothetical protein
MKPASYPHFHRPYDARALRARQIRAVEMWITRFVLLPNTGDISNEF